MSLSRKRLFEELEAYSSIATDDPNSEISDEEDRTVDKRTCTKSNRRFCPHCEQYVTLKTFRAHKKLYYSEV